MNNRMETKGRRIGLVLALGGLLVVVDTTVTMVAVPPIAADLSSSLPTIQWITTGYLLGVVAVIPLAAWTARRFGERRVYLVALTTFTVSSALVAVAPDAGSLIGFRVLQGLGGGLLNPIGMAIGLHAVPRHVRGKMMSLLGLPVVIGPVLGPPLAGALIDAASWRWMFVVNVPIGLATVALCRRLLPHSPRGRAGGHTARGVHWLGLGQLSGGAVLFVLGCTLLGNAGRPIPAALSAMLAGGALLATFTLSALRTDRPLVNLRLLRHRPLAGGAAVLVCFGAAYFGSMTILPIYVQAVRGDPAGLAGTLTVPMGLAVGLTLQFCTRLVDRIAPRRIVLTGTSLGTLGCLALLLATTTQAPYPMIAGAAAILGVGSGATLMPTMTAALRDLEGDDTPAGTTLLALLQQLASAIGAAIVATMITIRVTTGVPSLGGDIDAMLTLTQQQRQHLAHPLAAAVGNAYLVGLTLCTLSLLAAITGLRQPSQRTPSTNPEHPTNVQTGSSSVRDRLPDAQRRPSCDAPCSGNLRLRSSYKRRSSPSDGHGGSTGSSYASRIGHQARMISPVRHPSTLRWKADAIVCMGTGLRPGLKGPNCS
jgi:EmrB/QacA subfamily drug resistance transporter